MPKLHIFMLFEIFITISQLGIFMLKNDKGQRSPRNALCWAKVKVKVKSLSCVPLFATPWTVAYQAPQSMGFSRPEWAWKVGCHFYAG